MSRCVRARGPIAPSPSTVRRLLTRRARATRTQLDRWAKDLETPLSLWLSGLFNPMAFLTAIMQVTARQTSLPLDKMAIETHVTTLTRDAVSEYPEEGAYVHGLYIEVRRRRVCWEQTCARALARVCVCVCVCVCVLRERGAHGVAVRRVPGGPLVRWPRARTMWAPWCARAT